MGQGCLATRSFTIRSGGWTPLRGWAKNRQHQKHLPKGGYERSDLPGYFVPLSRAAQWVETSEPPTSEPHDQVYASDRFKKHLAIKL